MTFISSYRDRPDTLKLEHTITRQADGQEPVAGHVYGLNDFNITVWDDGIVTAQRKYHVTSSPDKQFPNMTVSEGSINLPIEDLVDFILARITPMELAEGIIADDEARDRLIYVLGHRYGSPGFEDADRRKWLAQVQEAVHSVALDKAIEKLNNLESANRAKSENYRWHAVQLGHYEGLWKTLNKVINHLMAAPHSNMQDINAVVEYGKKMLDYITQCHSTPEKLKEYIELFRDPVMKDSTGPQWQESRDFWRHWLQEQFPAPVIPEKEEPEL